VRKEPSDESVEQRIRYETPDGSVKTWSHCGVLPGGRAEALAEDVLEMEAEEEVPDVREVVKGAVTPDEIPVALEDDAEIVVEDTIVADAVAEELPLPLVVEVDSSSSSLVDAELKELVIDEVPELLADKLPLPLILIPIPLELATDREDEAVAGLFIELNLPGSRFR
jgi:hypothetical protein